MPWSDWSDTLHTSSHSSLFSYFTPVSYRQWYKQLVSVSFIKSLIKYTLTFQNLPSSTFSTSFSSSPLVWLDLDCEAVSGSPAHSPSFPSPPDFIEICPYVCWSYLETTLLQAQPRIHQVRQCFKIYCMLPYCQRSSVAWNGTHSTFFPLEFDVPSEQ